MAIHCNTWQFSWNSHEIWSSQGGVKSYQRISERNAVLPGKYVSEEPVACLFLQAVDSSKTFICVFHVTRIPIHHRENVIILLSSCVNCWSALFWLHVHNFHFWSLWPTSSTHPLKQWRNKRALGCNSTWVGCHNFRFPECTALYIFEEVLADFLEIRRFTFGT